MVLHHRTPKMRAIHKLWFEKITRAWRAIRAMSITSRATTHRVLWPIINRRRSVLRFRHRHLCGRSRAVAGTVSHFEGDGVNATVATTHSFGTQLDRLAVTPDDDVITRVAISNAVLGLITRDTRDDHAVDVYARIAKIAGARYQIGNVD